MPVKFRENVKDYLDKLEGTNTLFYPAMPLELLSMAGPIEICRDDIAEITHLVEKENIDENNLLDYSSGALIARGIFCLAHGGLPDGSIDDKATRPWARKIRRIVNLAGITRG